MLSKVVTCIYIYMHKYAYPGHGIFAFIYIEFHNIYIYIVDR